MEENKEISEHIKALGEWAAQDTSKRVTFIMCAELTDTGVKTSNSLVGRTDKIALALCEVADDEAGQRQVIELTAEMLRSPILRAIVASEAKKTNRIMTVYPTCPKSCATSSE